MMKHLKNRIFALIKQVIINDKILLNLASYCSFYKLDRLASIYRSDKFGSHFYTQHYQKHFKKLQLKKIKLLEIGIGGDDNSNLGGASLKMWKYFFPRGYIHGVDLFDKTRFNEKRIKTFKADQSDEMAMSQIVHEIGKIDIIIDDGSHVNSHVINSFIQLFPKLEIGGIYVVEDTQTSYWSEYGGQFENLNCQKTIMGFFKSLIDGLNYEEIPGRKSESNYFDEMIKEIHFYHNLIFIYKAENKEGSNTLKV